MILNKYKLFLVTAFIGTLSTATTVNATVITPVLCQDTARNHMYVNDDQVTACAGSGLGNIGQGGGNDVFLNSAAGSGYSLVAQSKVFTTDTVTKNSPITGQTTSTGTWNLSALLKVDAIGFKFGTGNTEDEWFVYDLAPNIDSGDWEFVKVLGNGAGGLSHLVGYKKGGDVSAPAILGIMGIGLVSILLSSTLRRRKIS